VGQRIKVTGLAALERELAAQERKVRADLVRTCRRAAEFCRTRALHHAAREGVKPHKNSTGKDYASSFKIEPTSDGAVLGNTAKHARFVEQGRRAGRPPPVSVILMWMFERGIIKKIPSFKQAVHVDKAIKGRTRRIMLGVKQEVAAQHHVRRRQGERNQQGEGLVTEALAKAGDIAAQHPALRQGGDQRAGKEAAVPQILVVIARLDAEVEGHAAQDQADQHGRHRQVERAEDLAVRLRKGDQQNAYPQHQPGFIGIPEGADGRDHAILVGFRCQRQKQANTEVETTTTT
jgi:hypothetical protein